VLKASGTLHGTRGYLLASTPAAKEWIVPLGVAVTVAVAYYLAAGLGLAFLSPPSDVADLTFAPGGGAGWNFPQTGSASPFQTPSRSHRCELEMPELYSIPRLRLPLGGA
jgi:hypothetical protein